MVELGFGISPEATGLDFLTQKFNTLLRMPAERHIPGIHSRYLYGGSPRTVFGWHVEDYWLHSANYLLDGSPKVWYLLTGTQREQFEKYLAGKYSVLVEIFC